MAWVASQALARQSPWCHLLHSWLAQSKPGWSTQACTRQAQSAIDGARSLRDDRRDVTIPACIWHSFHLWVPKNFVFIIQGQCVKNVKNAYRLWTYFVSKFWTLFGHILDIYLQIHRWPKYVQNVLKLWALFGHMSKIWALFGHILDICPNFGHLLVTFYTYVQSLGTFWSHFGHFLCLDTFWTCFGHI